MLVACTEAEDEESQASKLTMPGHHLGGICQRPEASETRRKELPQAPLLSQGCCPWQLQVSEQQF